MFHFDADEEKMPEKRDWCDSKKFQWSDYNFLDDVTKNININATCEGNNRPNFVN
jgi:hypothetical protein